MPVLFDGGPATLNLDLEPHQVKQTLGVALRLAAKHRDRLVELAGTRRSSREFDPGGAVVALGFGRLPEHFHPSLVVPKASVAFREHEIQPRREPGIGSQGDFGFLDRGNRGGPVSAADHDLGLEIRDNGLAQSGGLESADQAGGLVLAFDLVLEDQNLGQEKRKIGRSLGECGRAQDSFRPIQVPFPHFQPGQGHGERAIGWIALATLCQVFPGGREIAILLAESGRAQKDLRVFRRQFKGLLNVARIRRRRELECVSPAVKIGPASLGVLRYHLADRRVAKLGPAQLGPAQPREPIVTRDSRGIFLDCLEKPAGCVVEAGQPALALTQQIVQFGQALPRFLVPRASRGPLAQAHQVTSSVAISFELEGK